MSDAATHFTTEAGGVPAGPGRYVKVEDVSPVEFVPGLEFRPVLGTGMLANFVTFKPHTKAPKHVHAEEQVVIVLDGQFQFDIDGDVRTMTKGDVAIIPSWVPHAAWTDGTTCVEVDVFNPPRKSLLEHSTPDTGAVQEAGE